MCFRRKEDPSTPLPGFVIPPNAKDIGEGDSWRVLPRVVTEGKLYSEGPTWVLQWTSGDTNVA